MALSELAGGPEFDLIRSFLRAARRTHPQVLVGPGDDCAIVNGLAIGTDASVENVHFRRDWLSGEEIGWRAAAAAISDLAAVAAQPIGILVSSVLPHDARGFVEEIMQGAVAAVESAGGILLGGDVAAGDLLMLDVVAVGSVTEPVLRSAARVGDEIWVTGRLGGSAAAVAALLAGREPVAGARTRYARPLPRVAEARWLLEQAPLHAMIDLSDGLYGDAAHIAAASACGIVIDTAAVPVDEAAGATLAQATSGGEDYELCFTAQGGMVAEVSASFERTFGVQLTKVGEVIAEPGTWQRDADGARQPLPAGGYQHFGRAE